MKKNENNERLAIYKSALPHGYINKVAERADVKPNMVSMFLHGRRNSVRIEKAILETIRDYRKEMKELQKELEELKKETELI